MDQDYKPPCIPRWINNRGFFYCQDCSERGAARAYFMSSHWVAQMRSQLRRYPVLTADIWKSMDKNSQTVFGVLWDMDGVLADTGELHYQSWVIARDEIGFPLDREKFRQTFGMNNNGVLNILLGHPPEPLFLARVSDRKEGLFRQMIRGKVRPLPGVRTWLERLKTMDYRQAVASSAPKENIDALVDEMQIRPYFSAIVSAFSLPSKPDPAVFLEGARQIGVPPSQCVVIEDAIPGVEAAHRAGMRCIAVTTTNPRKDLSMADIIVDSLEELKVEHFVLV